MENQEIIDTCSKRRLALGNAMADPDVMAALAPHGYDEPKLDEGLQLIAEVEDLSRAQGVEFGEQLDATKTFYTTISRIN